jgi:hypothetical protein
VGAIVLFALLYTLNFVCFWMCFEKWIWEFLWWTKLKGKRLNLYFCFRYCDDGRQDCQATLDGGFYVVHLLQANFSIIVTESCN